MVLVLDCACDRPLPPRNPSLRHAIGSGLGSAVTYVSSVTLGTELMTYAEVYLALCHALVQSPVGMRSALDQMTYFST